MSKAFTCSTTVQQLQVQNEHDQVSKVHWKNFYLHYLIANFNNDVMGLMKLYKFFEPHQNIKLIYQSKALIKLNSTKSFGS